VATRLVELLANPEKARGMRLAGRASMVRTRDFVASFPRMKICMRR